ncbi:hypothetical protein BDV06DRAFT_215897 [Aspergillus oleicola]
MDKTEIVHEEVVNNPRLLSGAPGDVQLLRGSDTVLIPDPSPDPKGKVHSPRWAISTRANDLLTYPTLFMGIGNLISMPFALTIGRRPVFLASMVLLIATWIWCACSQSLGSHIAGRNIMSLVAGQSEVLSPAVVQEIHFLHERGRKLAWFIFIQNVTAGVFFVVSTYMVSAWGWRWWYGFFASLFERSREDMDGRIAGDDKVKQGEEVESESEVVTSAYGTVLDVQQFGPWTWRHGLKLCVIRPKWRLCIPITFWLLLLNGAFLGVSVFQSATFSTILLAPPYSFAFTSLGIVQAGQIVSCIIFLPLLGYGSDLTIRALTKRNKGLYKPEYRLPVIAIPAAVGVICGIIYGQAASFPENWNVSAIVMGYNASFFAFLGANIVGITYAVDSFPLRTAPFLVVICAGRGIISFGLSYATLPAVASIGYDLTMVVEMVICGILALWAVPMFVFGGRIRAFVARWVGV